MGISAYPSSTNILPPSTISPIYCCGVWDGLSSKHLLFLNDAARWGNYLIVGVARDVASPTIPKVPFSQRSEMLGALKVVSKVLPLDAFDPLPHFVKFADEFGGIIIVVGADQKLDLRFVGERGWPIKFSTFMTEG